MVVTREQVAEYRKAVHMNDEIRDVAEYVAHVRQQKRRGLNPTTDRQLHNFSSNPCILARLRPFGGSSILHARGIDVARCARGTCTCDRDDHVWSEDLYHRYKCQNGMCSCYDYGGRYRPVRNLITMEPTSWRQPRDPSKALPPQKLFDYVNRRHRHLYACS